MDVAAQLLRSARTGAGLSQRELADLAHTAQPRVAEIERSTVDPRVSTIDRVLRAAGAQIALVPSRAPSVVAAAAAIADALASHGPRRGFDRAFRALLSLSDGLSDAPHDVRVALCVAAPPPTGDDRFDAALAAVVDHHLSQDGLPVPAWVADPSRVLDEPWTVDPYAGDEIEAEAPDAFRRRGILLAERELASV